jgi:tetratricopeptide (TPR) repeat protein
LKGVLVPEGFFVQVFNLTYCRSDFLTLAVSSLDRRFKRVVGYLFSDHLVILAADDERSLLLNDAGLKAYQSLFKENPVLHTLFYNDVQLFTHVAAADMKQIRSYLERQDLHPLFAFQKPQRCGLDSRISRAFATEHLRVLEVVDRSLGFQQYKNNLAVAISGGAPVYSLLKQAGMYEISGDQGKEAEALLTLRRYAEYNLELRTYVTRLFAFKEEYYFLKAIEQEKSKNWEEAGKLYRAILSLNPDNFEANYRLGILSITLQNLDDAFVYLQKAMQLKRDDAKVLYQMGVLLFATGRLTEALDYLQRALSLNENSASVFYYLGLCNEKLGRLAEARAYYEKALTLDPNDRAIQSSMETIQKMLEDEKNKWKSPDLKNQYDVEQGESIPLPINKSAQDIRLKDEE